MRNNQTNGQTYPIDILGLQLLFSLLNKHFDYTLDSTGDESTFVKI